MASASTAPGGDGFLSLRLERALDMQLRRRVGIRDWALAVLVVGIAQLTGVNAIGWVSFAILLCVGLTALATWIWVFPRLRQDHALWLEIWMNAMTAVATLGLVAASGGAESPYIFFYAFIVIFVATFVEIATARAALIALACLCALAPIAYDWEHATSGSFLPTIVVAVVAWAISGALVALKRISAVDAEFEARRLAYVDAMTGASTRRAIEEYEQLTDAAGLPLAAAYVRATAVGDVNRVGGHLAGDRTLQRIAGAMREASGPADQVTRLSGVEFAVLMPGADRGVAGAWIRRFRERLALADALAADSSHTAAIAGAAGGPNFAAALSSARSVLESANYGRTLPACEPPNDVERAEHLHEQLARADEIDKRPAIESVRAPSSVWLAIAVSASFGVLVGMTGGANSVWLSAVVLIATYFATFGSRNETIVATVAAFVAVLAAVLAHTPVSSVDQVRTLTVLVTILVLADTVQRNVRKLTVAERRAAELSLVDTQTALGNRSAFERDLIRELPRGRQDGDELAVIVLDLGDLSTIGERIGRASEEFALVSVAEGLRDAVGGEGALYRIGSEDFAVVLHARDEQQILALIRRCREELDLLLGANSPISVGPALAIRIGAAIWQHGMTAADLAAAAVADQASQPDSPVLAAD